MVGSTTTYYVGAHYQVEDGVVTKYYFAGAQRVAMRKNGTLSYLLADHLGSTSLTTNTSGAIVSELRYKAWGETRYSSGTTPTSYKYTGQREEAGIGLYFYNARWYDPLIGRFTSADTITPNGIQGLDRYAYVNNSPMNYTDPSGHRACGDGEVINCNGRLNNPNPIRPGSGCGGSNRNSCLGRSKSHGIGEAGAGALDLLFDPYYGLFIEDLNNNSLTKEQLENIDSVWISADMAYDAYDINLEDIAINGSTNPLIADQIYEFLTTGAAVESVLMDRTTHEPYVLFLKELSDKLDNHELLSDPMQFEPNYLEALMVAHPDSLSAAMNAYDRNHAEEVIRNQASDILDYLVDKIRTSRVVPSVQ